MNDVLKKISANMPIEYIIGFTNFYGFDIDVSSDVLIPRADSETLVDEVIRFIGSNFSNTSKIKMLEIGVGSAALSIAIRGTLEKLGYSLQIVAVDKSVNALEVARKNIAKHSMNTITLLPMDILLEMPNQVFDIIISNPPYIRSDTINTLDDSVKNFEPFIALDGGLDGLIFYRRISQILPNILKNNGAIFLEIGYDQALGVESIFRDQLLNINIVQDCGKNDRVLWGLIQ